MALSADLHSGDKGCMAQMVSMLDGQFTAFNVLSQIQTLIDSQQHQCTVMFAVLLFTLYKLR